MADFFQGLIRPGVDNALGLFPRQRHALDARDFVLGARPLRREVPSVADGPIDVILPSPLVVPPLLPVLNNQSRKLFV